MEEEEDEEKKKDFVSQSLSLALLRNSQFLLFVD